MWLHWREKWAAAIVLAALAALGIRPLDADESARAPRHFASNGNFDQIGRFVPKSYGFDIADVASVEALDRLPDDVLAMIWLGSCDGADARFRALVDSVIDHPKLFGFYLMDDPDPSGRWRKRCKIEDLRAEADWIHERRKGAVTFVALMNVGSAATPAFDTTLRPENSHVDLFGVAPYPCRRDWPNCDYEMIGRFIDAAQRIGLPTSAIVPVYQTFGGGDWKTEGGGYRLPSAAEMQQMLDIWRQSVPTPVFDYAYSWGPQQSDIALAASADLLEVFKQHNGK